MDVALYLHFPYCRSRCTYCDFNAHVAPESPTQSRAYVDALIRDIRGTAGEYRLRSIFMGGGTPSLTEATWITEVLDTCREVFRWPEGIEVSLEANPGTVDGEKLRALKVGGVNRLSLGVQTFDGDILRSLNRIHTPEEALTAVQAAREAGFENLSLDLIYGLPGQTLGGWESTLHQALELDPQHLSVYQLVLEPGTHLRAQVDGGEVTIPDEDTMLAMDELTCRWLPGQKFRRYEISNWSLPGKECHQNQIYWRDEPYLGLGCGAVSYVNGWRARRIRHPALYVQAIRQERSVVIEAEKLGRERALKDTLMLGLRTCRGIDLRSIGRRYPGATEPVRSFLRSLPVGWLQPLEERAMLTPKGLDFWNEIYLRLMETGLTMPREVAE